MHNLNMCMNSEGSISSSKACAYGVTHVLAVDGYSRKIVGFITMPRKILLLFITHCFGQFYSSKAFEIRCIWIMVLNFVVKDILQASVSELYYGWYLRFDIQTGCVRVVDVWYMCFNVCLRMEDVQYQLNRSQ